MCPFYLDGDQALARAPGDTRLVSSDRRDRCSLAWLCSFQGPRRGARPAWAPGLSKLNSMRPPVLAPKGRRRSRRARSSRPRAEGLAARAGGRQVRSTYRYRVELERHGMCHWPSPALQSWSFPRKEVIQPHLPVRLPCYDFTPVTSPTFDGSLPYGLGHRLRVLLASVV